MDNNNMSNNENRNSNNSDKNSNRNYIFMFVVAVCLTLMFFYAYSKFQSSQQIEISYSEFLTMIDEGKAKEVKIYNSSIEIIPKDDKTIRKKSYHCTRISDIYLVDRLEKAKEKGELDYKAVDESHTAILGNILSWVIMIGAFYVVIWLFTRSMSKSGGGIMGVGRSNAKMYMEKKTGITFEDVAGQEESKESLKEMVDFLHNPNKY